MRTAALVLSVAALLLAALPLPAAAATTVGLVMPKDCIFGDDVSARFLAALAREGVAAADVALQLQRPAPDRVSRLNSIRKLIAYDAAVLVVWGGTGVHEASQETPRVPIVFVGAYDPVKEGIIADLNAPGRNITGVSSQTSLPFLLDAVAETGGGGPLGVIYYSENIDSTAQLDALKAQGPKKGFPSIIPADIRTAAVDEMMGTFGPARFIYLASGCLLKDQAIDLAKLGKPLITQAAGLKGNGIVFSLAPDPDEMLAETAKVLARILRGEKASQIPVASVKKIEFVIDLAEAQRLGLKVPFSVLSRATRVNK
jgi:putative ABC transport system substrate-binding protein